MRSVLLFSSLLWLAACDRPPEVYSPPEQRHPAHGYNPGPEPMMIEMNDPGAGQLIVKDIYPQTNPAWRWTAANPTFKIPVLSTANMKYFVDFSIWENAFKETGPLEVGYSVNGKLLYRIRYDTPGGKHFEKPVPASWLAEGPDATIGMSVDKLYAAHGVKFGVILSRIGFKPQS